MIAAIVPAAGRSRRMGRPKLLLPIRGRPLVTRVVDGLLQAGLIEIRVVVSPETGEGVRRALAHRPVRWIFNPRSQSAMLDSVRHALKDLPSECEDLLVTPADIPGISGTLVRRLIEAFKHASPEKSLVVPLAGGRRGHPLIFSAKHVPEVLGSLEEIGLRGLLQCHPGQVLEVPVPDPAAFEDIDTPADYAAIHRRYDGPEAEPN